MYTKTTIVGLKDDPLPGLRAKLQALFTAADDSVACNDIPEPRSACVTR